VALSTVSGVRIDGHSSKTFSLIEFAPLPFLETVYLNAKVFLFFIIYVLQIVYRIFSLFEQQNFHEHDDILRNVGGHPPKPSGTEEIHEENLTIASLRAEM
jgi:hypothetical protein